MYITLRRTGNTGQVLGVQPLRCLKPSFFCLKSEQARADLEGGSFTVFFGCVQTSQEKGSYVMASVVTGVCFPYL